MGAPWSSEKDHYDDAARSQGEHGPVHSLPLMSKGEEKDRGRVLPSMTKGEIVGNIVIDGKG
jgi:hypothetical protein